MSNFVPAYTADGHVIDVVAEGGPVAVLTCPGEGKCKATAMKADDEPMVPWQCAVKQWFDDAGLEFLEWQARPYTRTTLPCEIEWHFDGWGEDGELEWRPVRHFTVEEVVEIAYLSAGVASVPFMKEHPDTVMPTEEIDQGVTAVLREKGL